MYKFLGDIIVVEHIGSNVKSDVLVLPETLRNDLKPIEARVIGIGKLIKPRKAYLKDRKRRGCTNTVFASDYLKVGDIVLVPEELGTRNRIVDNPKAIIYDSEDVLALIDKDIPSSYYCSSHQRACNEDGCDKRLGGILLPCNVIKIYNHDLAPCEHERTAVTQ